MFWLFKKKKTESEHFTALSKKLEKRKVEHVEAIKNKHRIVVNWAKKKGIKADEIATKSAKGLATGVAAGAMILSSGVSPVANVQNANDTGEIKKDIGDMEIKAKIISRQDVTPKLKNYLKDVNPSNEEKITRDLSKMLGVPVKAQLDGIRLNKTYGIIGYESHLTRYPGETLQTHFHSKLDYNKYSQASMAGGPGAWGYIALSQSDLTASDIEREKYYLVAQTFLSPNWGSPQVKEWFHHRKMVVINPNSGVAVVGVLEDAGPEPSTGNSFGGSPEVMEELGFPGGGSNVYFYFIDDPKDQIPLGRYGI